MKERTLRGSWVRGWGCCSWWWTTQLMLMFDINRLPATGFYKFIIEWLVFLSVPVWASRMMTFMPAGGTLTQQFAFLILWSVEHEVHSPHRGYSRSSVGCICVLWLADLDKVTWGWGQVWSSVLNTRRVLSEWSSIFYCVSLVEKEA